ncbi:bifunctional demethylmenaquinone methyltransferase/2-methoxy-6-polyprenyl-1,4-benzoquinol methylase UbiE [bacterium]|nr:bifunctional demethylmenaquinone methyltransferase/2-methoxy-6-polyprenyl-1,4-benzoquinol methylase UbiE [bacterium]
MNKSELSAEEFGQQVQRMFNSITRRYDLLNHLLSAGQDYFWRRFCAGRLPENTTKALDIACGTADLTADIQKRFPEAEVYGLDFAVEMLQVAEQKKQRGKIPATLHLVEGDALELPFDSNQFDVTTIAFGLRNIPNRKAALLEMKRVVKPGGKVLVLEMTFPENLGLRWFFKWYLSNVIPLIGGTLSGSREAYSYLPESIQQFLTPMELVDLFHEIGLVKVKAFPLSLGIAYLHEGIVPWRKKKQT